MGSGPVCELARKYANLASVVLISPYTSLRAAAEQYVGSLISYIVRERFDNLAAMCHFKSPTMIIHGKKDSVIPY
jgi:hypothetical protein